MYGLFSSVAAAVLLLLLCMGPAVHHGRRHGFARPLLGLALVPNCSFLFPALFCEAYTPLKTLVETVPWILSLKKDGWGVQGIT